ncbi:MAG: extracellular solute-binding protein [Clostridia bacterium]|nr:extracellular solute-binding protein [Clostridia bacterium]
MKKTVSIFLAALMLLSTMLPAALADNEKRLTYTVFQQGDDVPNPEQMYRDSTMIHYWQDMFNIEFDWQIPPQGSESEQMNLMLGTGDYTDIMDMGFNTENLGTLCDDGTIYDLTPYLDEYMPNYKAWLDANPDVKSALFDDSGRIYLAATIQQNPKQWGGLVYRRDILETMTGGNVAFPSGNAEPTTIADWEYMLELMTQYFKAAGMNDYAGLILPAIGYFSTGEMISGFGIGGLDYLKEDGSVGYGIAEDNFYNYLIKMKEWYEKGYIYADFASRSQDLFYLPNTALTYGGAAGIWFGLTQQLGDTMSLPEYGLMMDVHPLAAPADTEHGIETPAPIYLSSGRATTNSGWAISTACSEEKLLRLLPALDWLYTDEGAATRSMGLSEEQGADELPEYLDKGILHGARENGSIIWTAEMDAAKDLNQYEFAQNRLPGIVVDYATRTCELNEQGIDPNVYGNDTWTKYGNTGVYPYVVSFTAEESERVNRIGTNMQDYAHPMIVNFIMGRTELTPEAFKAYQQKLHDLGLDEYLTIKQAAYDRFTARAEN